MRTSTCSILLLAASLSPGIGVAQEGSSMNPSLNPSLAPLPLMVDGGALQSLLDSVDANLAWGEQPGATWISATQFTGRPPGSAPALVYANDFFFKSPVSSGHRRYYAQVEVPPGLLIAGATCIFDDPSASENIYFYWWKARANLSSGTTSYATLASMFSSGTPGVTSNAMLLPAPETMHIVDPVTGDIIHHYIGVDVGGNTSFAGCVVVWVRQVAPPPSTATFDDVPTSHPFFQHIEALAGSGITSGCDANSYCPGAPLTRGQMAVFLARALGLGIPF